MPELIASRCSQLSRMYEPYCLYLSQSVRSFQMTIVTVYKNSRKRRNAFLKD